MAFVHQRRTARSGALWRFLEGLASSQSELNGTEDDPPWFEPGVVCEVSEETYYQFLEVLPPRWLHGNVFLFGEGSGPFRLFWRGDGKCFARELSEEETHRFCELSGTALHQ